MAKLIRGSKDAVVLALKRALDAYEAARPGSIASLFRQNPGAVYLRIIDDRFARLSRSRRHADVWRFLADVAGDDAMQEVAMLVLLAATEVDRSAANAEFEDPQSLKDARHHQSRPERARPQKI